jgi:hypothetical protein
MKTIAMLTPIIVFPAPFGPAMMTMRMLLVDMVMVTQKTWSVPDDYYSLDAGRLMVDPNGTALWGIHSGGDACTVMRKVRMLRAKSTLKVH